MINYPVDNNIDEDLKLVEIDMRSKKTLILGYFLLQ